MITKENVELLKKDLKIELTNNQITKLNLWHEEFLKYNSHTNLMSKKDIEVIFEKHVFDSLSLNLWNKFKDINSILDVGTGGGFPSVILSVCFPDKKIIANDSRIKKINFIKLIKNKLNLDNLEILYSRIEDTLPLNVDLIISRAVGKTVDVYNLSKKHLAKKGVFIIYKSKTAEVELLEFRKIYPDIKHELIHYNLPLEGDFDRNLIILQ